MKNSVKSLIGDIISGSFNNKALLIAELVGAPLTVVSALINSTNDREVILSVLEAFSQNSDSNTGSFQDSTSDFAQGKYVIVRTYSAGVHYGELVSRTRKEVVIENSRRIHYWQGRFTLSAIANNGLPDGCRISEKEDLKLLLDAIEVIPVQPSVIENMKKYPTHEI